MFGMCVYLFFAHIPTKGNTMAIDIFKEKTLNVRTRIINTYGPGVAVFVAVLERESERAKENGTIDADGFFTIKYNKLNYYLNDSVYIIRKYRKIAQVAELIISHRKGSKIAQCFRRYYKINQERIAYYDNKPVIYTDPLGE